MITILRLGHRKQRDSRISTHCGLVARAFGANEIIYSGEEDENLVKSVENVNKNWGGKFKARYEKNFRKVIKNFNGIKVHLTMYGLPFEKNIDKIRKSGKNFLFIIGGEKVPAEVYHMCDYNISVTNQPHSEVAALSVFLDNFFKNKEYLKKFPNAKLEIVPCKVGKNVLKKQQI